MFKKPFFSSGSPRLEYPVIQDFNPGPEKDIPLSNTITVYLNRTYSPIDEDILKKDDSVKTGQRIVIDSDDLYFISPATGTISAIEEYIGYLGVSYTSISITTDEEDQLDDDFKGISGEVSVEKALKYLGSLPGCTDFSSFINRKNPFHTIIIEGVDDDLLVSTNQVVLENSRADFQEGIKILKELSGVEKIIITTFSGLSVSLEDESVSVAELEPAYPGALPQLVMKNVLNKVVPAGKKSEDLGVGFIKAEAVAALSAAFGRGEAPIEKVVTVIDNSGMSNTVKVRIGTPVKNILSELNIQTGHGDRVVFGGPLRGKSIYSEDTPVLADTDAILVQNGADITPTLDNPCINCGECIRICPAKIPVNMLVRLLENSLYDEAAREYDLLSCVECGLCAYVCVARIPVLHYIMLGKNEYFKLDRMEESNA
ncbi:4Fe-4S dicluster domain-containing protein [Thermodesulfobacteriota bacterium]